MIAYFCFMKPACFCDTSSLILENTLVKSIIKVKNTNIQFTIFSLSNPVKYSTKF